MSDRKKSFMAEEEHHNEGAGMMRWLLTYADMITLLLGLFIVLVSTRVVSVAQYKVIAAQAERVFGGGKSMVLYGEGGKVTAGGTGILPYLKPPKQPTGGAQVTVTANGTLITMSTGVLFPSGTTELTAKAKEMIDTIYNTYLKGRNNNIMIKGHTDDRPMSSAMFPSNWELSTGRAGAVTRYLINRYGVNPRQLTTAGYADQAPVAPNDTEENRAKNRRIEIWVLSGEANRVMNEMKNESQPQPTKQITLPENPNIKPGATAPEAAPAGGGNSAVPGGGF
jgi:chemotaxis protein MotB